MLKLKCACCKSTLEIEEGIGQVSLTIQTEPASLISRLKFALGYIFIPQYYQNGGSIWVTPKRWEQFINKLNK